MFTGIIEETGKIADVDDTGAFRTIVVRGKSVFDDLRSGSSIAVNGVCLTARSIARDTFSAEMSRETLERTSLGNLGLESIVNLERPMRGDSRFGGHIVQGHVDGTARLVSLVRVGEEDWRLTIELEDRLQSGVVPQGSITVEGISLTVASIRGSKVEIAIIPHTYEATNLRTLRADAKLNVELDVIAKYATKQSGRRYTVEELTALGF